jgi:hypothetical protein
VPRPLLVTIALVAAVAAGCGGSPPFAARDLSPPGARHVTVSLQPTIAGSDDWSAPGFCGRVCAPALRPGEHVELCRRLQVEPILANELGPRGSKAVLCTLR